MTKKRFKQYKGKIGYYDIRRRRALILYEIRSKHVREKLKVHSKRRKTILISST